MRGTARTAAVRGESLAEVERGAAEEPRKDLTIWLGLLHRALALDRACLLAAVAAGSPYRLLGGVGAELPAALEPDAEPPHGPWSAVCSIEVPEGGCGLLLLSRGDGMPLAPGERELVTEVARALGAVLSRPRLEDELDAARALLAQADRLSTLGTLAAGIAHEIRNPLVSVRSFVQLAPERLHDEEFCGPFRDLALAEIDRICELLGELLAFSRPSTIDCGPVDLSELVRQTVRLLEPEARQRGVTLRHESSGDLPRIDGDAAQLKQVLLNLVLNALQASPLRATVLLRTFGDGDAVVEVVDEGPGIAPECAARIFEPFFTTKERGSGLGLFVAQRIVQAHGGTIRLRPAPGRGTVFTIRLPRRLGTRR